MDISQVSCHVEIVNSIVSGEYPLGETTQKKKKQNNDAKFYIWDEPFLFKQGIYRIVRRFIMQFEVKKLIESFHASPYGGHHGGDRTAHKVLQYDIFWPYLFRDFVAFLKV